MNALLTFHQKLPYTSTPCLRDQIRSHLLHHPASLNTLSLSTNSWKLHAQAKGFGAKEGNENAPKLSTKKQGRGEEDEDPIPQVVFDRMIRRIVASVGVPLVVGVLLLKLFDLLKENHVLQVPLWIPFITTFVTFGSSVLGVAYGSLSTSWDPEEEGSFLGLEQATQNWTEMWQEDEANK